MKMKGNQAVVEALKKEGVDLVFGYPGGVALPLYDALYDSNIKHILTRHEQGAVHAADGYARSTGKVGVCIATSGPGATNLVTGIATAHMDSVPLVCITCQVVSALLGKDSFQEADITGITTPITKHNFIVREATKLPETLRKAFYIASTGRPGPVLVDIPKDIFEAVIDFNYNELPPMPGYQPLHEGDGLEIDRLADALKWSHWPILFVGGGVVSANASESLRRLVEKTKIPVTSSLMGLGILPTTHPLYLGMTGMHGTYAANMAIMYSDLIIGCGVRFDDRVIGAFKEYAPNAHIAHFDIDPAEINKNVRTDFRIAGDLSWSLPYFAQIAKTQDLSAWHEQLAKWQEEHPLRYDKNPEGKLKPQEILEELNSLLNGKSIVVTDVGQHQMWAAQYMDFQKPRQFLTSGGLGTMGYGLPAAIGASFAHPGEDIWLISGDGSIMMNCQEMATAAEQELPVKTVIINNRGLGMVRQWQRLFYNYRYSGSRHEKEQNFALLAQAMGCTGFRVETKDELKETLIEAQNTKGPVFIDVAADEEENVFPMVAPGQALHNMVEYNGGEE